MRCQVIGVLALVFLSGAGSGCTEAPPPPPEPSPAPAVPQASLPAINNSTMFLLDMNRDGVLSAEDLDTLFGVRDQNRDGLIDPDEFIWGMASGKLRASYHFRAIDRNQSGTIERAEMEFLTQRVYDLDAVREGR